MKQKYDEMNEKMSFLSKVKDLFIYFRFLIYRFLI
jgi:hypothetical protein